MQAVSEFMQLVEEAGAMPPTQAMSSATADPVVQIDGREVLVFCSSNYLGLATHPEVKRAVVDAVEKYGLGANGSRLISGTTDVHLALEAATARLKGTEAATSFPTGFMANTGAITGLAYLPFFARMTGFALGAAVPEMVVVSDELNHASIIEGRDAARGRHATYRHCDMRSLEEKLAAHRGKRLLVVTDAVFSMDGDIAPVPEIVELSRAYGAQLLLDDAHGSGVLGRNGRGTLEHFGVDPAPDILQMGTYSKSYGAIGGFVATDGATADYLRVAARSYMFSGAVPACVAAGALKAMEIAEREPQRRVRVLRNRDYVAHELRGLGFEVIGDGTPIVPVVIGDDRRAGQMADDLLARGLLAPCVRWPAVARGESRIRITLTAAHERSHLDRLLEGFAAAGRRAGAIA
ncbi:MAG TPA: aminotransferase class I/II-fold pyridoxal phosphate-dependent enzyme [Thermoleophilia bacterium]|nr:MAG: 8-amino-7-oxononanoate synthase/2-amino-3-ketobutyrate coenzyme A ligase [Actinobacteria bacterium ADurb.BinA094]HOU27903.1 aminotransferase class I/II-fold pyridoxal phosphate-dependent enzyme [Thermoleophilia bacterium]HQF52484.1 aminotransferase class I/II-fold pyridoxal phosphate-dependent enzyme [Thermoleophilia bacterium]HQH21668.1 aminotransferase class I/II-fold pyridoxal phosphate-dependent enzyme [Thermoleophilia bacterium]HQJ26101.1 aminotransferase class I/II-fold pyridoxal 